MYVQHILSTNASCITCVQGLYCSTGGWLLDGKLSQCLVVGGISGGEVMGESHLCLFL